MVAGLGAGIITTATLHPLDVVRMRFQVERGAVGFRQRASKGPVEFRSTASLIRHIMSSQGLRGLYPGVGPALFGSGVSWGLYFFLYERAKARNKRFLFSSGDGDNDSSNNDNASKQRILVHLVSGVEAGVVCVLCTNPIWLVKTRLALQQTTAPGKNGVLHSKFAGVAPPIEKNVARSASFAKPYRGAFDAFSSIVRHEGVLALYKGVGPALALVSHGVIQFCVYEELKRWVLGRKTGAANLDPHQSAAMGAAAKLVATTTTYPFQVVKARVQQRQQDPQNTLRASRVVRDIVAKEGFSSFYKGLGANLLRVAPAAGITFASYEEIMKLLRRFSNSCV